MSKMKAIDVLDLLYSHYSQDVPYGRGRRKKTIPSPWCFFREVKLGTGKVRRDPKKKQPRSIRQRIDAWAYNTWPSQREAISFEVKVSRADFLHELRSPRKREAAMAVSNKFYFVVVDGVVSDLSEIPEDCGYMITRGNAIAVLKEAPYRPMADLPMSFISSLLRRVSRMEIVRILND